MIHDKHNTTPTHERECRQCGVRWTAARPDHPRFEGEPVLDFCDCCKRDEAWSNHEPVPVDEPEWTTVNPITGEVED